MNAPPPTSASQLSGFASMSSATLDSQFSFGFIALEAHTAVGLVLISIIALIHSLPAPIKRRLVAITRSVLTWLIDSWLFDCLFSLYRVLTFQTHRSVYLIGISTFDPPADWQVPSDRFEVIAGKQFNLPASSVQFCMKVLAKAGLGERTSFPPGICNDPPNIGMRNSRLEAETVLFSMLDQLFASTHIKPKDIDILVVNCSLFNPTPSMASMIVNRYKMRNDIQSYQLGGMGCSAGVISLHLARDLLTVRRNARALILSTENITPAIYLGTETNMLVSNSLFRCGGSACMLSNKPSDRFVRKEGVMYRLLLTHRTHMGASDEAYNCVYQREDDLGFKGVQLSKELMKVAAKSIAVHLRPIAHRLLTSSELLKAVVYTVLAMVTKSPTFKQFTPSFSGAVYPCIHAGGAGVLNAMQTALKLSDDDMAVSRLVLYERGNVSSASVFYELEAYHQGRGPKKLKSGDRVWQVAFGSGFKVNSAIWQAV